MSTVTFALRFVFAALVLASISMAQNQWSRNGGVGGGSGAHRKTNIDPNPFSLTGPHPPIFDSDAYSIRFLPIYIKKLILNIIRYLVSLVTRLLPDRHQYLREVADAINGIIDCGSFYLHVVLNLIFATYRVLARIPIIGWIVVYLPVLLLRILAYYPNLIINWCINLCLGILL